MAIHHSKISRLSFMVVLPYLCFALVVSNGNAAETVVYSQGFESNNGNYTHSGILDKWEWGTPAPGFGPGAAHSGSRCWGTDLDDTVPYGSNAYCTSPAITLPTLGANQVMRVRFFGWIAVDFMADRGQFQVSSDGMSWETKAELLLTMLGGWNEYVFDISDYTGSPLYLRFRCFTDNENNFDPPTIPYNMDGFYIDDIAITVTDAPAIKKILTFEGNENQVAIASCPWIYIEGKKGTFEQENDIFSTARGSGSEYTDFYQLNKALAANKDEKLIIKLKETEQEESYTDLFHLLVVDHAANVDVAIDENGNVFTYRDKKNNVEHPSSAIDNRGLNVLPLVTDADEIGCKAYDGEYVDLTFNYNGNPQHPIFLLRAQGFLTDTTPGSPLPVQPKINIQTQNSSGQWITRKIFYPRWKPSFSGYDMAGLFPYSKKVRLLSSSCLTGKYHLVDWAAISTQSQKSVTITELAPESAIRSDGTDMTTALSTIDGNYAHMTSGEEVILTFDEPSKSNTNKRDIFIKSRGYYIPTGTYFFYTWDGANWVQRDGWSIPTADDQTREFDLSLWLPDPDGNNRVRIWQDFFYDPAAIDYVGLRRDNVDLIMNTATDLRNNNSVLNSVNVSDNNRHLWDWGEDWGYRNRWVEIGWTDTFVNTPPSTNPVFVTNNNSSVPTINWTYVDLDANPQSQYEIEVWGGPGGTGSNLWDPQIGLGTATTAVYGGTSLESGLQYYARVKAFDSLSWGTWSEVSFTVGSNHPPVAEAGTDRTVTATLSCQTTVALDGSASYDPDNDPISFLWTGPFGTATGSKPAVFLYPGTFLIRLIVSDNNGGTGMDSVTITVLDIYAPIPDSVSLPQISGDCSATITNPPTATDNCAGMVVGTTDSLMFTTPGTRTIVWHYDDGNGNIATQSQIVVVADLLAPLPDATALPVLSGDCFVSVSEYPTATDNCSGTITGTTTDSLVYSQPGTFTITWSYVDANENVASQTQTVTIADQTAPIPDVASLPTLSGTCTVSVNQYPTATDACAGSIIGTTTDPLNYTSAGTYTVTWRFVDGSGNAATQTQSVVIADNTPPIPDVASLPAITGSCAATVSEFPTATDNCAGSIIGTTTDPLNYTAAGTYTITWRYVDGSGNAATQTQSVVIADNTPPIPDVASLPAITGSCAATVSQFPTATDGCAGTIAGTTTDPLNYTAAGTYTITWRYVDGSDNATTQTQSVVIADNTAPIPDVASLPAITGTCAATVSQHPTATDNCAGSVAGTTTDPLSYTNAGTYTVTWRFDDGRGNVSTQTQSVVIIDNTPPVPDVVSLPAISGSCAATISQYPTATDECAGRIVGSTTDPLSYTNAGAYTVTWRFDDGRGNVSTQTQPVVVADNAPPVPDIASLPAISGSCAVTVSQFPTATDNCAGRVAGTTTNPLTYTTAGTYSITWRYVDGSGNSATQTQSVVIADNIPPVPNVASLPAITGSCAVTIRQFPTATDNCAGRIIGTTANPLIYTTAGVYTITWRYVDRSGNTASQAQTVVIADVTAPVADVSPLPAIHGDCHVNICTKPTATDDCKGKIVGTTTDPLSYTKKGTYTITWRYFDGNGNVSTQTQTVTIDDVTGPIPDIAPLPVIQGDCNVHVCKKPTATDNCSKCTIVGKTTDPLTYSIAGMYVIHWIYTDKSGNTTTQSQTVIVRDNGAPVPNVATLPVLTGYIKKNGKCYQVRSYPSATDNCQGRIVATTSSPLQYCNKGNFIITWRYDDGNGNITTQNQTVQIR